MKIDNAAIWRLNYMRDMCEHLGYNFELDPGSQDQICVKIWSVSEVTTFFGEPPLTALDQAEDWLEAHLAKKDEEK